MVFMLVALGCPGTVPAVSLAASHRMVFMLVALGCPGTVPAVSLARSLLWRSSTVLAILLRPPDGDGDGVGDGLGRGGDLRFSFMLSCAFVVDGAHLDGGGGLRRR